MKTYIKQKVEEPFVTSSIKVYDIFTALFITIGFPYILHYVYVDGKKTSRFIDGFSSRQVSTNLWYISGLVNILPTKQTSSVSYFPLCWL